LGRKNLNNKQISNRFSLTLYLDVIDSIKHETSAER
jgi:hypothetical protein